MMLITYVYANVLIQLYQFRNAACLLPAVRYNVDNLFETNLQTTASTNQYPCKSQPQFEPFYYFFSWRRWEFLKTNTVDIQAVSLDPRYVWVSFEMSTARGRLHSGHITKFRDYGNVTTFFPMNGPR